jgi:hypothetical protein
MLGAFQKSVRDLQAHVAHWIGAEPARERIHLAKVEVPSIPVRLASVEPRTLEGATARSSASPC